jgi:hypothetical protein
VNGIIYKRGVPVVGCHHSFKISVNIVNEVDCINCSVEAFSVGVIVELCTSNGSKEEGLWIMRIECDSIIGLGTVLIGGNLSLIGK